ncbi:DNA polymerase I [Flavicella sediminum]|uniref:DNA polymerase I n=1 Tax=Flavicella sediminum TaxID=2585141 RepID=UPI0011241958|nr:DNA polymerase I [Flavicella sediminum]
MAVQKRVFLLDAFALIFRGYYALIKNPRINSKGMDTSAILGFTNSLLDVIRREKPDLLAVAFDKGGSDVRRDAFPEYKANRQETPEAIKIAVPYIHEILKAMNIPIVEREGIEADDLIGTLSKQAEKEGYQVYMVTPDKDYAQLVSENIFMYRPARMGNGIEIWDVEKVKEKFEIEDPLQVIDYLGMMGDAVDNIPGLPGVGDKTAKKFLKAYGSMEGLLANTHELKGKMKEKVEANKELGLLSKQLATIMLDCPVTFNAEDYLLCAPDFQKVNDVFQELEFRRSLETVNKLFKTTETQNVAPATEEKKTETPVANTANETSQLDLFASPLVEEEKVVTGFLTVENTNHVYQYVNSAIARKLLLQNLLKQNSVCFGLETDAAELVIIGISFSYEKGKGYYVALTDEHILNDFKAFFEEPSIEKIGHNLKRDSKVLGQFGVLVKGELFDTQLAHYLLNPDMRHHLNVLSETYLNYQTISRESIVGKGRNLVAFDQVAIENQAAFAVEEVDIAFQLKEVFQKELEANNLTKLFTEIEIPLLKVLAKMEIEGINLNTVYLAELSEIITKDIQELEMSIYSQAGEDFNLASPKQLGIVLFEKMKLVEKPKKTKTGQYATNEDVLSKLASEHEIVREIQEWRGLVKLKSTYIDALPNEVNPKTKRIHTTYGQTVAATGRLSSNNPNLQNIPIRTERGKQVREAFVPRNEEYVLFAADYSQIELRIIAALSEEENMIQAFKDGQDIHATTAAKVFNIPLEEVTRAQRSNAKAVNFGILYGQGAFTLADQTGMTRKEAKDLIAAYYETYPTLKAYMAKQVDFARDNGYVETILGRRRYLKNINSQNGMVRSGDERNAVNAPIQGSAADIIKIAMINIQKTMDAGTYKSKMLLQVHDELVFDMHKDEIELLKPIIKKEMENAYTMSVPLDVEMGQGDNWLQAH